ncbi:hypothetical protein MRX96_038568 [Rhipicephalus microplus]
MHGLDREGRHNSEGGVECGNRVSDAHPVTLAPNGTSGGGHNAALYVRDQNQLCVRGVCITQWPRITGEVFCPALQCWTERHDPEAAVGLGALFHDRIYTWLRAVLNSCFRVWEHARIDEAWTYIAEPRARLFEKMRTFERRLLRFADTHSHGTVLRTVYAFVFVPRYFLTACQVNLV